jgi:outer membrane protein assembly factor BamB/cytochrome c553
MRSVGTECEGFSRAIVIVLAALAAAAVPVASSGQSPDGAAVYKETCARCHDSPQGRTPGLDALKARSADVVLASLNSGSMSLQAQALSPIEKRAVAEYVAGKPIESTASIVPSGTACETVPSAPPDPSIGSAWNGWGRDANNTRFQPSPGLTAADVPSLTLKWAFGFPGGAQAYGQPTVVGGRVFVGSDVGRVYSLQARTGCTNWAIQVDAGVRTAITIGPINARSASLDLSRSAPPSRLQRFSEPGRSSPELSASGGGRLPPPLKLRRTAVALAEAGQPSDNPSRYAAYFGDLRGNVYAVDADTGETLWKRKADDHRFARITGAPALHAGRLYVPVSSVEEGSGGLPTYACCTFRGSVVAYDATTGSQIWKTYTIPEAPHEVGRNSAGTAIMKPAGAAVWNSPTIDVARGVLYIGTGNSYTEPAVETSDAVMAIDLNSGKILWWNQVTPSDAFVIGCQKGNEACPQDPGPDFDFGNSPILRTLEGAKRLIVIGQKSGVVYGLDPDREGRKVWEFRAGKGGALGGIEWGSAADEQYAYVPVSDVLRPPNESGGLFALKLATGEKVWHTPHPHLDCTSGRGCSGAQSAPVAVIPGVVFSGSIDGHMRAYSTRDGAIIWDFDTARPFDTVNRVPAKGGSIDAAGPVIAEGQLFTNSGYALWKGMPGNVLLAFGKP